MIAFFHSGWYLGSPSSSAFQRFLSNYTSLQSSNIYSSSRRHLAHFRQLCQRLNVKIKAIMKAFIGAITKIPMPVATAKAFRASLNYSTFDSIPAIINSPVDDPIYMKMINICRINELDILYLKACELSSEGIILIIPKDNFYPFGFPKRGINIILHKLFGQQSIEKMQP